VLPLGGQRPVDPGGDQLERPVLQEPREQQVSGLQQSQVLRVLDLTLRQQPGGLEIEKRRRDDEELARLLEVPVDLPCDRMCAMNSSVTAASAISVTSSL
jgi:hypothetical protein